MLQCSRRRATAGCGRPSVQGTAVNALVAQIWDLMSRSNGACAASSRAAALGEPTHVQGGTASWDSSGSEKISPHGLRCCEASGFGGNAWVCEFQSTQDGVNTCVVSSGGFGGAASLSVFQLRVQEGNTQPALTKASPRPVAKSFLLVGDVVVRRQDTTRTSLKAFCPSCGMARHHAAWDDHCRGSAKIGEQLLLAFCDNDVANVAVWKRAVVEGVAWWNWLRAVKRLVNGWRAIGSCVLVSRLSTVLEGITNSEISGGSIAFAVAAAVTPPRPDCVTENTGGTVEMAQLCNALLDDLLSTVLLNHVLRRE